MPEPSQLELTAAVTEFSIDNSSTLVPIIAQQEEFARFKRFNSNDAFELGSAIRSVYLEKYGKRPGLGAIISIQLWSGHVLFTAVVGDAPYVGPGNWNWAKGKFNVVKNTHKSSLRVGRELAQAGKIPEKREFPFPEYACHGGGFPLWIKGVDVGPIGAILVSGLPQLEDHQLIVHGIIRCSHLLDDR